MKFNELFDLVVEQRDLVIEEGFKDVLKKIAILAVAGIAWNAYRDIDVKVGELASDPKEFKDAEKKAEINLRDPKFVENIKNIYKTKLDFDFNKDDDTRQKFLVNRLGLKNKSTSDDYDRMRDFIETAKEYITRHEIGNGKIHNKAYRDNKGYVTVGIGHKVVADDIKNKLLKPGEYVLRGKDIMSATLSTERVHEIFNHDFNKKLKDCRRIFPGYDAYPLALKVAILDGFFRGDMSGSRNTQKLIRQAMDAYFRGENRVANVYLRAAAKEYLNNKEYRTYSDPKKDGSGIARRMERNANEIVNALKSDYKIDTQKNSYDVEKEKEQEKNKPRPLL